MNDVAKCLALCWAAALVGCSVEVKPVAEVVPAAPIEAAELVAEPQTWPWWRGPDGSGTIEGQEIVNQWSATESVVWKSAVPGRGHSSPIVTRDSVLLTTADEKEQNQSLLCYDRVSGDLVWETVVHEGGFMRLHGKNSHASATPASDGESVLVCFINDGALWVTSVALDGEIRWQKQAGPFTSEHGYGSSPILYQSLVIVAGDNLSSSFVAALNRSDGEIAWRTKRKTTGAHGSYATPALGHIAGRDQLVLMGMGEVVSYDPATGKKIWFCKGPSEVAACTVAFDSERVYATGGYPEKEILAIKGDSTGEVSDAGVAWRSRRGVTYVPSPIHHDGRLYVINDGGVVSCLEAVSGKTVWKGRLSGNFTASPILVNGQLIVTNESGKTYIVGTGDEFEIVAENSLHSGGFATAAVVDNRLFLRTAEQLYCIGAD